MIRPFLRTKINQLIVLVLFLAYDYFLDKSNTINLLFGIDFSELISISFLFIIIIFAAARIIETFLHEMGHWLSIFGRGKLHMNWMRILIPFWPGKTVAYVESDRETPGFWKPVLDIAGIIVNFGILYAVYFLFKNYDMSNYFHVLIFFLGFSSLISFLSNIINASEESDFSKFLKSFNAGDVLKSFIAIVICTAALILFKTYYVDQFIALINVALEGDFFLSFSLPLG